MDKLALILVVAVATYATRLAGLTLRGSRIPPLLDRFLAYIPIAVFAALIAPNLGIGTSQMAPRLIGVVAAALVVLRVRWLWAGLVAGMAAYWLARAVMGS
jgi:branched-subunit amino acid transport protein